MFMFSVPNFSRLARFLVVCLALVLSCYTAGAGGDLCCGAGGDLKKITITHTFIAQMAEVCNWPAASIKFKYRVLLAQNEANRWPAEPWIEKVIDKDHPFIGTEQNDTVASGGGVRYEMMDVAWAEQPPDGLDTGGQDISDPKKFLGTGTAMITPCPDPQKISLGGLPGAGYVELIAKGGSSNGRCGEATIRDGSAYIAMSMGPDLGDLYVEESTVTPDVYTPAVLQYHGTAEKLLDGGSIRQVFSKFGLANVQTLSNGFKVHFFRRTQVGPKVNGFYTVPGVIKPFVSWMVDDPGNDANGKPRLRVTEYRYEVQKNVSVFTFDAAANDWQLNEGSGERTESRTQVTDETTGNVTTTRVMRNAQNSVVQKRVTVMNGDRVLESREGEGSEERITSYEYDTQGRLTLRLRSDGYYEKVFYPDASNGLLARTTVTPIKDLPLAGAGLTNGHLSFELNGTVIEKEPVGGVETIISQSSKQTEIVIDPLLTKPDPDHPGSLAYLKLLSTTTGVSTGSASPPLVSVSKVFLSNEPAPFGGRVRYEQSENGTTMFHDYEEGTWDPATKTFTVAFGEKGLRHTATQGVPDPVANVTTRSVEIFDENGNLVAQQELLCTDSWTPDFTLLSQTISTFDEMGNVLTRESNGTLVYSAEWEDGKKISETDQTGVTTHYLNFDYAGRPLQIVRDAIPAGGGLPAISAVTTDYTYDAEGRKLSEVKTSAGVSQAQTWQYDTAGRLKVNTNAGITREYTYALGGRRVTTTLPGGLTKTTETYLDGSIKSISGTALVPEQIDYGRDADGYRWTKRTTGGGVDPAVMIDTVDWAGRPLSHVASGPAGDVGQHITYNEDGSVASVGQTGLAPKVFASGYTLPDAGGDGFTRQETQDLGTDGLRNSQTRQYFESLTDGWYSVIEARRDGAVIGYRKTKRSGFAPNEIDRSIVIDRSGNQVTCVTSVDTGLKALVSVASGPGMNTATSISRLGLTVSKNSPSVSNPEITTYDGFGRITGILDPRTGESAVVTYDAVFGRPASMTSLSQNIALVYYSPDDRRAGLVKSRTVNGRVMYFDYDNLGNQTHAWGSGGYPTRCEYDDNGRKFKLHTYRNGDAAFWSGVSWPPNAGNGDVTQWVYFPGTSSIQKKVDTFNAETKFLYWSSGLLKQRRWSRAADGTAIDTNFSYNSAGQLKLVDYSDSTPDVSFTYNGSGRIATLSDAGGTHTLHYRDDGLVESETIAGGVLGDLVLQRGYTSTGIIGLLNSLTVSSGSASMHQSFAYESGTAHLTTASDDYITATYSYFSQSDTVESATMTQGTAEVLKSTRTLDNANRLVSLVTKRGTQILESHTWNYDAGGRRTRDTSVDGSFWQYGFNHRGELTDADRHLPSGERQFGYAHEYFFDSIGNRTASSVNGHQFTYSANGANQYESEEVPGVIDVLAGTSSASNTAVAVSVSGRTVIADKQGNAFYAAVPINNSQAAQYPDVLVRGLQIGGAGGTDYQQISTHKAFIPKAHEEIGYDSDGNLTLDGRWTYSWNAENQLSVAETSNAAVGAGVPKVKLIFTYDALGRRIQKEVFHWNGSSYSSFSTVKFVYDGGSNLLAEISGSNQFQRQYLWGADLGSARGSGGIGGLVNIHQGTTNYLPMYDGNGNIVRVADASSGTTVAEYGYSPFGEVLRMSGAFAAANPFRWSTKYHDEETGLAYFGNRFYSPRLGRWISRDPVGESGGNNLHAMVLNNPIAYIDRWGNAPVEANIAVYNGIASWEGRGSGSQGGALFESRDVSKMEWSPQVRFFATLSAPALPWENGVKPLAVGEIRYDANVGDYKGEPVHGPFTLETFYKRGKDGLKDLTDYRRSSDKELGYCVHCEKWSGYMTSSAVKPSSWSALGDLAGRGASIAALYPPTATVGGVLGVASAFANNYGAANSETKQTTIFLSVIICADKRTAAGAANVPTDYWTDRGFWDDSYGYPDMPNVEWDRIWSVRHHLGSWIQGNPGGDTGVYGGVKYEAYNE